jgi:hypothetical protein
MKSILAAALCLGFLAAAGCRSDANRELLERELRDHEDQIYELQDQCDDLHHQLEACRHENEKLKGGAAATEPGDSALPPPRVTPPPPDVPAIPKIDLGTPDDPPPVKGNRDPSAPNDPPRARKPAELPPPSNAKAASARPASLLTDSSSSENVSSAGSSQSDGKIARLAISRLMTGGHSFSGKPGDDGLLVVFTPRNSSGRPVRVAGDVSIVAIDPQAAGAAARVARWDFAAAETGAHYRQGVLGSALHFELLWPERPPEHTELKLFVRLTTPEGDRFDDNQTIRVRLAGNPEPAQTWAKPEAPNRWERATLPSGAEFDPSGESAAANPPPPDRLTAKNGPPIDANSADGDSTSRTAGRRSAWSPNR